MININTETLSHVHVVTSRLPYISHYIILLFHLWEFCLLLVIPYTHYYELRFIASIIILVMYCITEAEISVIFLYSLCYIILLGELGC